MKRLLVFFGLALAAGAQTFPVEGVVVNSQSGAPMARVQVVLSSHESRSLQASVVTGDSGHFSFLVPQGHYALKAQWAELVQTYGIGGPELGFGVAIITGPGQDTSHLIFNWYPTGAITGTVIDDRGEPVEDAMVQLLRSSIVDGRKRTVTNAWFRTDDRGIYRIAPLRAGTYYVAVTAQPWYAAKETVLPGGQDKPYEPSPAYAPSYYSGASDLSSATPLVVKPGAEVRADFTLRTVAGVRVHINCPFSANTTGTIGLVADGPEGARGYQREEYFYGSGQTISGVPPGRYDVRIAGKADKPFSMQKTIDVGATDVTVDMAYQAPPSVRGRITFSNPDGPPKSTVYVRLVNEITGYARARAIQPDGSFVFETIGVGRYTTKLRGAEGSRIAQVSVDGASFRDGALEITDGAAVTLNLAVDDQTGHVKGFAVNSDQPVPGVLVVMAPAKESHDPAAYVGFQTDSDGSFDFGSVPVGDYVLFAVTRLDLEYANPAAVRPYLAGGRSIRVGRHGTVTERVPVIAPR